MNIKIVWKVDITENNVEYDDEEKPLYYQKGSAKIEIEERDAKEIKKAFQEEDGDGDDSGSWSRYIVYVLREDGLILYEQDDKTTKEEKREQIKHIYYLGTY